MPSAIDREESIFERMSTAYHSLFGAADQADPRTDTAACRLAAIATKDASVEEKAYASDKSSYLGRWAHATAHGSLAAGRPKCNYAVADWITRAGMHALYRKDTHKYADTNYIYANAESFRCWRPTSAPKAGDIVVWADKPYGHMGIVTNPAKGEGISAGKKIMQEYQHFARDASGTYRGGLQNRGDAASPNLSQKPEAKFLEYHCPDHRTFDKPNQ